MFTCLTSDNRGNGREFVRRPGPHCHQRTLSVLQQLTIFSCSLSLLPTQTVLIPNVLCSSSLDFPNSPPGISVWPLQEGCWVSVTRPCPGQRETRCLLWSTHWWLGSLQNQCTFSFPFHRERKESTCGKSSFHCAHRKISLSFFLLGDNPYVYRKLTSEACASARNRMMQFVLLWVGVAAPQLWFGRMILRWKSASRMGPNVCRKPLRFYLLFSLLGVV